MYKKITYPGLQRAASKNQKENSKDKIKQKRITTNEKKKVVVRIQASIIQLLPTDFLLLN